MNYLPIGPPHGAIATNGLIVAPAEPPTSRN
jgi:hypothetical protein